MSSKSENANVPIAIIGPASSVGSSGASSAMSLTAPIVPEEASITGSSLVPISVITTVCEADSEASFGASSSPKPSPSSAVTV